jgi:hypothetical protein
MAFIPVIDSLILNAITAVSSGTAKWIVLFVETFVASVQIGETKLSHANLLRSEPGSLESDLHAA